MKNADQISVFGSNIATLRKRKQWTLNELSKRSHVSVAMLSEIERGNRQPTIELASRIAKALETTLGSLIEEGAESVMLLRRRSEQPVLVDPKNGVRRTTISESFQGTLIELLHYELPGKADAGTFAAHMAGTVEYLTVIKGKIAVRVGDQHYAIGEGDCLSFEANKPHGFSNVRSSVAILHLIIARRHRSY